MNRHLPVLHREGALAVQGLVHLEHGAVGVELGGVGAVRKVCGLCRRGACRASAVCDGIRGVSDIDLLNRIDPAETYDLALDSLKAAGGLELAEPGIIVIAGHVVVRVIAGHDHERPQDDFLVAGLRHSLDDALAGGLLRLTLDGTDEDIFVAELRHLSLHLAVAHLRGVGGAVAQEDKCSPLSLRRLKALIAGRLVCLRRERFRDRLLVLVHIGGTAADFPEERLRNGHGLKFVRIGLEIFGQLVVLRAVHEVGRLDDQVLHTVFDGALKGLLHVVDEFFIAGLYMIDDDLGRKCPPHRPVRIRRREGILDPLHIVGAAVVK